jgi:hypothetical protein
MMFTIRFWGITAVLLWALLLQNCQSNSPEEEPSASPSSASVMHQHTPSEPMVVQPSALPSASFSAHVATSRFSTTLASSEEVLSAAPSSSPLGPVARHVLATVENSPTAPNNLPAAAVPEDFCSEPSSDEPGRALSPDGPRVCESRVEEVLREIPSDGEEDSRPLAQQRFTNLASKDDLASEGLRAGEEAEEGTKNDCVALKMLGEVEERHCVKQRGQSGDPLTILLDVSSSQPDKAIQFLDVLLVAAQDNGCRQQALEALGKIPQASSDMLSECLSSLRAAAKGGDKDVRLLALKTLGEVEWKHYFGEVGPAPDLPEDMVTILDSTCPFWPDKKVKETHLLALIPTTVDGRPFTLNLLGELIQHPKNGGAEARYRYYNSTVKEQMGSKSPDRSYWLLMTRYVLPGSCDKTYADHKKWVADHASRTSLPYELPKTLEAATAILTHYVRDGERLLNSSPRTFTRCQEWVLYRSGEHPTVVGDFGSSGLDVNYFLYEAREYGVACCRKFF